MPASFIISSTITHGGGTEGPAMFSFCSGLCATAGSAAQSVHASAMPRKNDLIPSPANMPWILRTGVYLECRSPRLGSAAANRALDPGREHRRDLDHGRAEA